MYHHFCGPPGASLFQALGLGTSSSTTSWFDSPNFYYVHKGRTAIRYVCQLMNLQNGREVLAPSYNCGSEIDPLIKGGASVVLYRVDRSGLIDFDDLQGRITSNTKAIYVTHYFGFPQSIAPIKHLCEKKGLYLIEDCALSLFSCDGNVPLGRSGDISVFSLTKTLPVPDGGVLAINNSELKMKSWNLKAPNPATIFRGILPQLKSNILRWSSNNFFFHPLYLALFNILKKKSSAPGMTENECINPDILPTMYYNEQLSNRVISSVSMRMLATFNPDYIISRRRNNFSLLLSLFSACDKIEPLFKKLPEGVCPLNFPIIVRDRDLISSKLYDKSIDAGCWWKGYHQGFSWGKYPDACFLKNSILTLPVHQDLSDKSIQFIAERAIASVE